MPPPSGSSPFGDPLVDIYACFGVISPIKLSVSSLLNTVSLYDELPAHGGPTQHPLPDLAARASAHEYHVLAALGIDPSGQNTRTPS